MFKLFKRKSKRARPIDHAQVQSHVVDGRTQMEGVGMLPQDLAAGDLTSDYIAEAATPSDEAWAREQARYRAKNEREPPA